jgi:hypothetical protein
MDVLEKGLSASNFAMLGLGDIVIPGKVVQTEDGGIYRHLNMYCTLI